MSKLETAESFDYWELRFAFIEDSYEVISAGGTQAKNELSQETLAAFEAYTSEEGFGVGCLPGYCYYYIVSVKDAHIKTWSTPEKSKDFLGNISSKEEAILLVLAHGYHWDEQDKNAGAIRSTERDFELIVLDLVKACDPVQTNRYVLLVTFLGEVVEKASEVGGKT